ncbi:hypothetical protein [Nocardioides sp. AE5]|uniref:hypothetical protein n=1 Tax=Nocardioides sp. AE5 TaxID=2962573 RepID=UPI002880BF37|nr:hypothetical protein [Nocardioides sp. AE5]MDT0203805.1 hypothetical protein [Nocardioides sp. AE5]
MSEAKPVKRPRHLMDPNNPVRNAPSNDRSLTRVQKWVMSTLAVSTILHLQVGLILFARSFGDEHHSSQVGVMVISAIFGMLGAAAGMAIHQKNPLNGWLLLGTIPTLVAIPFVF